MYERHSSAVVVVIVLVIVGVFFLSTSARFFDKINTRRGVRNTKAATQTDMEKQEKKHTFNTLHGYLMDLNIRKYVMIGGIMLT